MIEVKHLTKFYGDHKAVDDISFSIKDGTVCGFLGPNGAGKSTTMNIMTGCLSATSGSITIGGFDIFENPIEAKKTIGYLPEQPPLYFEETPREYLRFVAEAKKIPGNTIRDEIERIMAETQITDVADRLIKNLSKGYKQRVGIAQTLLGNPKVIILDEPTVGLDPIQVVEIRDLIKSLGKKHTVILSSHILSEVQNMCDEIIIISKGKLIAYDTAENLEKMMQPKLSIELLTDADEEESRAVLGEIEGIEKMEFSEGEHGMLRILIDTPQEKEFEIRKVLAMKFAERGRAVLKMDTIKANLEEIFIELTNPDENTDTAGPADPSMIAEGEENGNEMSEELRYLMGEELENPDEPIWEAELIQEDTSEQSSEKAEKEKAEKEKPEKEKEEKAMEEREKHEEEKVQ